MFLAITTDPVARFYLAFGLQPVVLCIPGFSSAVLIQLVSTHSDERLEIFGTDLLSVVASIIYLSSVCSRFHILCFGISGFGGGVQNRLKGSAVQ